MVGEKIVELIKCNKLAASSSAVTALSVGLASASSFAAEPAVPGVAITTEMLIPLVDGVSGNIAVILPIGITLFAIFLGIGLIPKIIRHFL